MRKRGRVYRHPQAALHFRSCTEARSTREISRCVHCHVQLTLKCACQQCGDYFGKKNKNTRACSRVKSASLLALSPPPPPPPNHTICARMCVCLDANVPRVGHHHRCCLSLVRLSEKNGKTTRKTGQTMLLCPKTCCAVARADASYSVRRRVDVESLSLGSLSKTDS